MPISWTAAQKLKWHLWKRFEKGRITCFDTWDTVIEVLEPLVRPARWRQLKPKNIRIHTGIHLMMSHLTHQNPAIVLDWFIFEEIEAVIKMVIKGRSPHTRHVSRTHRVDLNGLAYVNTRNNLLMSWPTVRFSQEPWAHLTVNNLAQWHIKHLLADYYWFFRVLLETCRNVQETWTMNKYRRNLSRQYELFAYQKGDNGSETKKDKGRH